MAVSFLCKAMCTGAHPYAFSSRWWQFLCMLGVLHRHRYHQFCSRYFFDRRISGAIPVGPHPRHAHGSVDSLVCVWVRLLTQVLCRH